MSNGHTTATKTPRRRYRRTEPDSKEEGGRNLLLFLDGTNNTFGAELSNVIKLASLADQDPAKQLVYYQSGIGIDYGALNIFQRIAQIVDSGVAFSLPTHVQHAYTWLMNHWKPGDKIFLFGFSRGAFQARALAGMLQQVGLLPAGNEESVAMAYSIYAHKTDTILVEGRETLAQGFKRTFSRDVYVHYVGVWDTVSSVGAIIPRTLPFASGSRYIRHFRAALALDERRARFAEQPYILDDAPPRFPDAPSFFALPPETCTIKEVWFAGAHSNVGGGEFDYDGDIAPSLSHLSLRWMVRESVEAGFEIDQHALTTNPLFSPFHSTAKDIVRRIVAGKALPEDQEFVDFLHRVQRFNADADQVIAIVVYLASQPSNPHSTSDALAPRGDHLSFSLQKPDTSKLKFGKKVSLWWQRVGLGLKAAMWWILEVSPTLKVVWDLEGNVRRYKFASNFGRGRILLPNADFHYSVKTRIDAEPQAFPRFGNNENVVETSYHPRARFRRGRNFDDIRFVE